MKADREQQREVAPAVPTEIRKLKRGQTKC